MNIATLRRLFGWGTLLNSGLLIFASIVIRFCHAQVFGVHSRWIPLSEENFNLAIYLLLGIWKLLVIVFNLVPYAALVIVARHQRKFSIP